MDTSSWSRAPWSTQPGLKLKTDEVGIDFDAFIRGLAENRTNEEMACAFAVPVAVIASLREHFMRFGIDSVMGQD